MRTIYPRMPRRIFIIIFVTTTCALFVVGALLYTVFLTSQSNHSGAEQKTITLSVYFGHKNITQTDCASVLPVKRVIPYTEGVARAALEDLFKGPTEQEKRTGYTSVWGNDPAILRSVSVENGIAYVDLRDIRPVLHGISSSCGSSAAFAQLTATLTRFSTVHDTRVAINGNPETFYEWTQIGCVHENDYCNPAPFLVAYTHADPWTPYTDSQKLFSLSYPNIFSKTETMMTPYPLTAAYPAITFEYRIPVDYCALSGSCVPYTINMQLRVASLPFTYQEIHDLLTKDLPPEYFNAAGKEGFIVHMGAEGEGIYYYALPLDNKNTLIFTRTYLDESILIRYRTAPTFIPFADQKRIFEKILKTLVIN